MESNPSYNRCSNCDLLNLPEAQFCMKCRTPLAAATLEEGSGPDAGAAVESKTEILPAGIANFPKAGFPESNPDHYMWAPGASIANTNPKGSQENLLQQRNNKIGSRTYFWYRMFCSVVTVCGIILTIIGILALLGSIDKPGDEAANARLGGFTFMFAGAVPAFLCLLGVVFPPRTWSWIFGLIVLVLATLSCWLSPFSVPLLVFWINSETQSYFGRK